MDIIEQTRELCKSIQKDERYTVFIAARDKNDADEALQADIDSFSDIRGKINSEMHAPEPDRDKLDGFNKELQAVYNKIFENPNMQAYNDAKAEFDSLLSAVNLLLQNSANGADPDIIDPWAAAAQGCTSDCSTCGGCG